MDQFIVTLFCTFGIIWVILYLFGGIYLVEDMVKIVRWFRGTEEPPCNNPAELPTGVVLLESHNDGLLNERDALEENYLEDDELNP